MAKKNTFDGAVMLQSTISAYYPGDASFDHFVFQQMIADSSKADDEYTLIAYVVNKAQMPIRLPDPGPSNATPFKAGKRIHFANMRLDAVGLANLYPNGVNSDMGINPTGLYSDAGGPTNYVQYTASTVDNPDTGGSGGYPINPSPPYNG